MEKHINWQSLFSPGSIAVIGASNARGSWGYNAIKGLLGVGNRPIYAVNPNSPEVLGIKAYRSVVDIPEPVDFAVIVVAARLVPVVLRECVVKGIKAAIVISAGFAETGERGEELEKEIARISNEEDISFIGPNSLGHANTRSKLSTFGQAWDMTTGPVAVISQSGNMCAKIVRNLLESGVTFSKYVSTGNEANLHMEDYLEYLAGDEDTGIIAAYIEGLREGKRFLRVAKELTARKPVVVIKVGGTQEAARAVKSHTGALAGRDEVYNAAFRQTGVIRVDNDDELCDVVLGLLNCPLPHGNRVGILSIGGGPAALTAEACEKEGLAIGKLEPDTVKKLDKYLPERWPRRNPVDMAGPSAAEFPVMANMLWALLEDKNIDIVFMLAPIISDSNLAKRMGLSPEEAKAYRENEIKNLKLLREKIDHYGKPVVPMWQSRSNITDPDILHLLRQERIPLFSNSQYAIRAMSHLAWYRQYLDETAGK